MTDMTRDEAVAELLRQRDEFCPGDPNACVKEKAALSFAIAALQAQPVAEVFCWHSPSMAEVDWEVSFTTHTPKDGDWFPLYAHPPAAKPEVTCAVCEELVERIGNGYVPNGSSEEHASLREAALERLTAAKPDAVADKWCPSCDGAGYSADVAASWRPVICPDCAGSGKAEHSITVNEKQPDAVAGLVDTSGIVRVLRDFFFDAANQQHIPTLTVEFAPVPVNSPNDEQPWKDRDRLAAILTAATTKEP